MIDKRFDLSLIEDKRVVLLQSGGLDSCYIACLLERYGFEEIHHVFVDYGQNSAEQELKATKAIVEKYGGELHIVGIDLPWLKESTLLNGHKVGAPVIERQYGAIKYGTYVPMRNSVLISIASSLAESLQIRYIATGLDGSQDCFGEPLGGVTDKHPNYAKALEEALSEGSAMRHVHHNGFELITPIICNDKKDTIASARFIGCDLSLSWSCYNNGDKPCGNCGSCFNRKEAFEELNLVDPALTHID